MQTESAICRRAGEGPVHNILGMVHEYKLLASESGQFMSFIAHVPPGCGAPMHHHDRDSESFYMLEGEITMINADGSKTVAGPGDYVWFGAGHEHAFCNEGTVTARAVVTQSPGVEAEHFFAEIDARGQAADFEPMRDVTEIGSRNGVRIAKVPEFA
jgi:mannose-6-phosphate isomerase-like protein (cupin superfamily)